jgi:hypothetical protein
MTTRMRHAVLVLVGLGVTAALLLVPLPGSWRGIWQSKLLDLAHVPLFAALTCFLWALSRAGVFWPVVIAVVVAGLAELLQDLTGRTGDLSDFLRGALGALAAGVGIAAWQRRRAGGGWWVAGVGLAAGLLIWPLVDALPTLVDAAEGARDFPTLADFQTQRQLLRWRCRQAELTRTADPVEHGSWVGRLDFFPGPQAYPYGALRPIRRDFRAYRELCCSFTVAQGPTELVVSLRSGSGEPATTTHYQEQRPYPTGIHLLRLNLAAIAAKARPYPLDLSDVWIIQFFLDRPETPHRLDLHRIWLEP